MKIKPLFLLPLIWATVNIVQAQDVKKYQLALETQLSCSQTPQPSKAIQALQQAGVIAKQSYFAPDAIKYFKTRGPLEVWGMKVVSVFAWDDNPKIFGHGPGTAPPIMIGIVVPYSEGQARKSLSGRITDLTNITIEPATETMVLHRKKQPVLTQIYCGKL
jgi:hypothetical protein